MWQRYLTPSTVDGALELLAQYRDEARIIAGGTDLIIELERGVRDNRILVDITRIDGLDEITRVGDTIHLGPLVTHNQCVGSPAIVQGAFPLARACWEVGAPQIRNRSTIVGNVITASPANDSIPALLVQDAEVTVRSVRGERTMGLQKFITGFRQVDLAPDEMVTGLQFPALAENARGVFIKLGLRRAQAISVINVAVVLHFKPGDGTLQRQPITQARVALGSVAPTVVRATEAEAFLTGRKLTREAIAAAADKALSAASPIDDIRGTAEYRREMVRNLVARALYQIVAGEERAGWAQRPVMLWGEHQGHIVPWSPDTPTAEHGEGGASLEFTLNGRPARLDAGFDMTLLDALREHAHLPGAKEGCAEGECGACTVFLDGMAVMSCMVPAPRAHGAHVVTVEGLARPGGDGARAVLHAIQQGFIEMGGVQCGYCTPGLLMSAAKLLEERPHPSLGEIQEALTGNLCRCTGYTKILAAVRRAAELQGG